MVFDEPGVQPSLHVHAPLEACSRSVGGSTTHCSSLGAFGFCSGMTTSVSDTVPPARSITLSARATVDAVISLNEYFVYANFVSAIFGMPLFHWSGIWS